VSVVGEAGLGKSRLVDELEPSLRRLGVDARVIAVSCAPYGSEGPLAPLAAAARALLEVDADASPAEQRAQVATAIDATYPGKEDDRRYLTHRTLQLLGLSSLPAAAPVTSPTRGRRSDELTSAARLLAAAAARDRPLVVIVDDVHYADVAVVDVLERLATSSARRPVVAVAVGRDELLDLHPGLASSTGPRHLVLHLRPLDDGASGELLHRTLVEIDGHSGTLAPVAEDQILRAAGGNPLLLDQLVRYLRETEALGMFDGGWRVNRDLADAGLPDDARALLGARLDGLPSTERAVLQGAAIVGRTFTPEAVAAMEVPVDDELVASLERRGLLVQPEEGSDDGALSFRHAMVRDAAYASVPIGDRASKHALLARWLGRHDGEGDATADDGRVAQVAHHVVSAVALAQELGQTSLDIAALSTDSVVAAARRAHKRDQLQEAERWYRRARELDLVPEADALAVMLEHGSTLLAMRSLTEAQAVLTDVVAQAEPGSPAAGEAHTGLGVAARLLGDADGARRHFETGCKIWQSAGDLGGEAGSLRTHGWAELVAGRPRAALPKLLRALELDELTGRPKGITLQCLAWCEFLVGDHAAARANLWDAARDLSAQEDRLALGWCFGILGNSLRQEGRVAQAQNVADNLLRLSRGLGDPSGEGMCLVLLAACQLEAGDPDAAGATIGAALWTFAELDNPWGEADARLVQGMVERVAGDLTAAQATLERGLQTAHQIASVGAEAQLRAELAATLLDAGDQRRAAREARATLKLVRSGQGDRDSEIRALVVLAKRARDRDDDPDARQLLDEAIGLAAGEIRTSIWRRAVAWSAILAADAGEVERAQELAADALSGSWESARTWVLAQRAVAAAQRAGGNRAGALATLDAVLGRFRDRPLAFLDVVRSDIRDLQAGSEPA
jgi:tetratricopeptide (TPR) repeat protein